METLSYDKLLDDIARSSYSPWTRKTGSRKEGLDERKGAATSRLDKLIGGLLNDEERKYCDDDLVFTLGYKLLETYRAGAKLKHKYEALFIMDFPSEGAVDCVAFADTLVLALARLGRSGALSKVSINTSYSHMWISYKGDKKNYIINSTTMLRPKVTGGLSTLLAYNYSNCAANLNNSNALPNNEKYTLAVDMADKGIQMLPNDPLANYCKAFALVGLKKYDAALSLIDKVIKAEPEFLVPLLMKADVLNEMGRYKDAERAYENTISAWEKNILNQRQRMLQGDDSLFDDSVHSKEHTLQHLKDSLVKIKNKINASK